MNKLLLVIPIAMISLATVPSAKADMNMSLRICEYVQANDKTRLRKFLKTQKIKIRNIYKDLRCNQDNLLVFAAKSKALDVGDFLIGKLPSKLVAAEIDNITAHSPHLASAAKKRVK